MTQKSPETRTIFAEIQIEYEINFDDFAEAQSIHTHWRPWLWCLTIGISADCFLVAPLPQIQIPLNHWLKTFNGTQLWPPFLLILALSVPLILLYALNIRRKGKPWNRRPTRPVQRYLSRLRDIGLSSIVIVTTAFLIVIRLRFQMSDVPPNSYSITGIPGGGPNIAFAIGQMSIPLFIIGSGASRFLVARSSKTQLPPLLEPNKSHLPARTDAD